MSVINSSLFTEFLNKKKYGIYNCFSGIELNILLWFISTEYKSIISEFNKLKGVSTTVYFFISKIFSRRNFICNNIYLFAKKNIGNITFELVEKRIHREFCENTCTYILWNRKLNILETNKFTELKNINIEKEKQILIKKVLEHFQVPCEIIENVCSFLFYCDIKNIRLLPLI